MTLLFRIVSRVCKQPGIYTPLYAIHTFDHNAVCVGMDKVVIQNFAPYRMHEFAATVRQNLSLLGFPLLMKT